MLAASSRMILQSERVRNDQFPVPHEEQRDAQVTEK
jgi:hypothetical protein